MCLSRIARTYNGGVGVATSTPTPPPLLPQWGYEFA